MVRIAVKPTKKENPRKSSRARRRQHGEGKVRGRPRKVGPRVPPEEDEGAIEEGVLLGVAKADVGGFAHGGEALAMARNEPQCRRRRRRMLLQNCGTMNDDESRDTALKSIAGVG